MKSFREYVDKKSREGKRQLKIIKKMLEGSGLQVKSHLDESDPYVFVKSTVESVSFEGIRIYSIADNLAFRVQKEETTHPYGKAYPLDLEEMFNDLLSDNLNEEKAGKRVIKYVVEEVKDFFSKSGEAEKDLRAIEFEKQKDPMEKSFISAMGTDYASMIRNRGM